MANIIQIILDGKDQTGSAFASAVKNSRAFAEAQHRVGAELKTTSIAFNQAERLALAFGANGLASAVSDVGNTVVSLRELNKELGKSKLAVLTLGSIVATGGFALGKSLGEALGLNGDKELKAAEFGEKMAKVSQAIEDAKLHLAGSTGLSEALKTVNEGIQKVQESAEALGALGAPSWLGGVTGEAIDNVELLGRKYRDLRDILIDIDEKTRREGLRKIFDATTQRNVGLNGGQAAILLEQNRFYEEQRKAIIALGLSEDERTKALDRLNNAHKEENDLLEKRGTLLTAQRDQALQGGLDSTVNFTKTDNAEKLAFLEANRGFAQAYFEIWSNSLLNLRASFVNFSATVLQNFSTGIGNAVASIATGAQTASQAFAALGKQMLGLLVSFAARLAVNAALSLVFQTAISQAASALALTVAAAWAPAAAFVSLATLGANAAPAAAGLIGTVGLAEGLAFVGQAHAGMDAVPREGSYVLQRNEMVIDPGTSIGLRQFARDYQQGGDGGGRMVQITFNIDGTALAKGIGNLSRDGRLEIQARSIT